MQMVLGLHLGWVGLSVFWCLTRLNDIYPVDLHSHVGVDSAPWLEGELIFSL